MVWSATFFLFMTCFYSINSLQWITKREKTICVYNKMYNFRFNTLKQINKNISLASITRRKTIGQRFIYFCLLTLHFARALFIFSAVPVLNTVFTSVSLFVPSVFFFSVIVFVDNTKYYKYWMENWKWTMQTISCALGKWNKIQFKL